MINRNENDDTNILLQKVLDKVKKDPNLENQTKNIENILNNLEQSDAEKIKKILSDEKMTQKILMTPKAQNLMKKILGE